jgi:hypothetical protein
MKARISWMSLALTLSLAGSAMAKTVTSLALASGPRADATSGQSTRTPGARATVQRGAAVAPLGWEITSLADRTVTWAAPKGWKVSGELPVGAAPASISVASNTTGDAEGWLTVEARVAGKDSAQEILARRPQRFVRVATEDGWTCGEDADGGAEIACVRRNDIVTVVVALGGGSRHVVADLGGVAALRQAAALIQGVWPKGLEHPDAAGRLPAVSWTESSMLDGHAVMAPSGWTARREAAGGPAEMISFNARAGAGEFSITALPGVEGISAAQVPIAEARVVSFLVPDATLSRQDGWTCGEGIEKASGLPAIICNRLTDKVLLYVSVRAEPAVFRTLGGVSSVRRAASRAQGFTL